MPNQYDVLGFADSHEAAEARADEFFRKDPFDEEIIRPALLTGADIYDYVRVTGMIFPFDRTDLERHGGSTVLESAQKHTFLHEK